MILNSGLSVPIRGLVNHLRQKTISRAMSSSRDHVYIQSLKLNSLIGPDCWNQLSKQNCQVTLNMTTDFDKASSTDDLSYSLNYAVISRDITKLVNIPANKNWNSLGNMAKTIAEFVMKTYKGVDALELRVSTQDGHIRSNNISCIIKKDRSSINNAFNGYLKIENITMLTLIGVFTFERLQKQYVTMDLTVPWPANAPSHISYKSVIDRVTNYVESSNFKTVEALVANVSSLLSQDQYFESFQDLPIEVKVTKLNAITQTDGVGVSCVRAPKELKTANLSLNDVTENAIETPFNLPLGNVAAVTKKNTAYVAFGANVGDVFANITKALQFLNANPKVNVRKVSSFFQSEPMYFKDQNPFTNGVIELETELDPNQLLELCKEIEYINLKRVKKFDNGPRSIDLDIILYYNDKAESISVNNEKLIVPHPRMLERTFVLEPLCELIPPTTVHPITREPIFDHLAGIYDRNNDEDLLWKIITLPNSKSLKFMSGNKFSPFINGPVRSTISKTYVMSILNCTPDSFSDGSDSNLDIDQLLVKIRNTVNSLESSAEDIILDIGGCSTRPNSKQVSLEEELERTIPLIKAIKSSELSSSLLLSVDTYRSEVAKQSIEAGVDIINDISGGSFDPKMFNVIASNPQVAYVLSHIRGNISTMSKMNNYDTYDTTDTEFFSSEKVDTNKNKFIRAVSNELSGRYDEAIRNGVKRWQIILDPGLGFAKAGEQNVQIINQLPLLKRYSTINSNGDYINFRNLPVLLGPSRKKFIGDITNISDAKDRDFATNAVLASCINFDANILRVHDTVNCAKSVKIADVIHRRRKNA